VSGHLARRRASESIRNAAIQNGLPIATVVIEGACRHLVNDRLDLTGTRWGLHGAEAVLKVRATRSNGVFEEYWQCHLAHEQQRNHRSRYANSVFRRPPDVPPEDLPSYHLRTHRPAAVLRADETG